MFEWLGRHITRYPKTGVVVWVIIALTTGVLSFVGVGNGGIFNRLQVSDPGADGSDSQVVADKIAGASTDGENITFVASNVDLADQANLVPVLKDLGELSQTVMATDGVEQIAHPWVFPDGPADPRAFPLVAHGGDGFLITVSIADDLSDSAANAAHDAVVEELRSFADTLTSALPEATTAITSMPIIEDAILGQLETDLIRGEAFGLPVALILMVIVFGGLLAAGLPLFGAIVAIMVGIGALWGLTYVTDIASFIINVVTIVGLGLSIDYGLLVVSRFREETQLIREDIADRAGTQATGKHALPPAERSDETPSEREIVDLAVIQTVKTAGRTVSFSALTIACSIAGLLVIDITMLKTIGLAGIIVVILALLTSVTLVPAVICLLGVKMLRPSPLRKVPVLGRLMNGMGDMAPAHGVFSTIAKAVRARPWLTMVAMVALLAFFAHPITKLDMRSDLVEMIPRDSDQVTAMESLDESFPLAGTNNITVVIDAPAEQAASVIPELMDVEHVTEVLGPLPLTEDSARATVLIDDEDISGETANTVVKTMRGLTLPHQIWVGGQAAHHMDFNEALYDGLPWAVLVIGIAIFALMFLMTGSIITPLKAIIINAFSLIASLGITVWIFQGGHGAGIFDFTPPRGIEPYVVAITLAMGFGLAMDYEVFLLSRIKEYWDEGHTNDESIAHGLQRSGRIITSAAAIIIAVFIGFVFGELLVIKEVGLALAITVAVDATLVRMLLVPSTMTLLGKWNWWAPAPLRRFHEKFHLTH